MLDRVFSRALFYIIILLETHESIIKSANGCRLVKSLCFF